jgi:hypothetical protein
MRVNFTGTGITWIGARSDRSGIAQVFIDGFFQDSVDQFTYETRYLEKLFSIQDLPYGSHTFVIKVTNQKAKNH